MRIEYSNLKFSRANGAFRGWQRATILTALSLAFLSSALVAKAQIDAQAAKLLNQMASAERAANYSAIETITRSDATVRVRLWRLGHEKRLEYLEPAINRGDVLVDDGQNTWLYHRAENAAIQTRSQNERLGVGAARRFSRVSSESRVDGRDASVVDILRSANGGVARRVWIDRATKLRLSVQFFDAQNQATGRISISDLKVGGVDAARFDWQPPANAQIVRTNGALFSQLAPARQSASWLQHPRFVPAGFRFESAVVDNAQGKAWLRYASESQRFSIFQQRAASASSNVEPQKVDGGWYRVNNGSRLLIAGAPDELAQRILQSVR